MPRSVGAANSFVGGVSGNQPELDGNYTRSTRIIEWAVGCVSPVRPRWRLKTLTASTFAEVRLGDDGWYSRFLRIGELGMLEYGFLVVI